MSDRPESTLGYERRTQHLFKLEEEAFVREIIDSVPPMPSYYPGMKELNSAGAADVSASLSVEAVSPVRFTTFLSEAGVTLIDLRRPEAFGGAHIPGAINIGAGQNLSLWAGWLIDAERHLLLVNDTGDDEEARRSLVRVGLDHIDGFLQHGMANWIEHGLELTRTIQFSTKDVAARAFGTHIVDVRSDKEWENGHIEGAVHIPLGELRERLGELTKTSSIVTVCGSGYRSSIAASLLQAEGFPNVSSMSGGMTAWNEQCLPVTSI